MIFFFDQSNAEYYVLISGEMVINQTNLVLIGNIFLQPADYQQISQRFLKDHQRIMCLQVLQEHQLPVKL